MNTFDKNYSVVFPSRVFLELIERAIVFYAWNNNLDLNERNSSKIISQIIEPYVIPFLCANQLLDLDSTVSKASLLMYSYLWECDVQLQ